jgi:hypothetical protein
MKIPAKAGTPTVGVPPLGGMEDSVISILEHTAGDERNE